MNKPNTISHEDAVAIDTKLAELWAEAAKIRNRQDSAKLSLASSVGIRAHYVTRTRREVPHSLSDLQAMAAAKLVELGEAPHYKKTEIQRALDHITELQAALELNRATAAPLEETFNQTRWARFFLVTNANGHIHSSMNCSTCNMRTSFSWLPNLSGLTEKDAVEEHGPRLCTVCYPSAPTEWTLGHVKDTSDLCPGSGQYQTNPNRRRYLTCEHCSKVVNITPSGKLRAHKPS
jgi:hypothetical protein